MSRAATLAVALSESFYRALAAGEPLVVALALARITLEQAGLAINQPWAWFLPVLFLRSEAVRLWTPAAEVASSKAAAPTPAADGPRIPIGTINAADVSMGDMTVYQQGGTFNIGGGADPAQARKLDDLLAGQATLHSQLAEMRLALLARFDTSEQRVLGGQPGQIGRTANAGSDDRHRGRAGRPGECR